MIWLYGDCSDNFTIQRQQELNKSNKLLEIVFLDGDTHLFIFRASPLDFLFTFTLRSNKSKTNVIYCKQTAYQLDCRVRSKTISI